MHAFCRQVLRDRKLSRRTISRCGNVPRIICCCLGGKRGTKLSLFGDERDRQVYDVVPFNLWSLPVTQPVSRTAPAKQRTQQQLGLLGSRPFRSRRMVMTEALNERNNPRVIYISA